MFNYKNYKLLNNIGLFKFLLIIFDKNLNTFLLE